MDGQELTASQKKSGEARLREEWSCLRLCVAAVVESKPFEGALGTLVCLNSLFIILETDVRAAEENPGWLRPIGLSFLTLYTAEVLLSLYVYRRGYFRNRWNLLDFCVVSCDLVSEGFAAVLGDVALNFSVFRVLRIFRLFRFVHLMSFFKELSMMLHGCVCAMKAIFWATFMLVLMVTVFSIFAVEVLHPINKRIAQRGDYEDCERCERAFSSVFDANLTFLQQIVAGDSWGAVSVPIIEEVKPTIFIFLIILITINFGLLNLILTVIVDTAAEARENDESRKVREKSRKAEMAKKDLVKICSELDTDCSGELTLEELSEGMQHHERFASTMALLDVTSEDMGIVFSMLDGDKSGYVTYTEFVDHIHKMKSQNTHTMLIFIKIYLNEVRLKLAEQMDILQNDVQVTVAKLSEYLSEGPGPPQRGSVLSAKGRISEVMLAERTSEVVSAGQGGAATSATPRVEIKSAKALQDLKLTGKFASYCTCEVEGKPETRFQTRPWDAGEEPLWNFEQSLEDYALGDSLVFALWAKGPGGSDCLLSSAAVTAEQLQSMGAEFDGEVHLSNAKGAKGRLHIKLSDMPARPACSLATACETSRCTSCREDFREGILRGVREDFKHLTQHVDLKIQGLSREVTRKLDEVSKTVRGLSAAPGELDQSGPQRVQNA